MTICGTEKCLNPDNVNKSLKNIFKFIVQNQVYYSGSLQETSVLLKISLTQVQSPTTSDRMAAENRVSGIVTEISDTYVVMLAKTACSDIYSEYTIEYNKIIYLYNIIFYTRYNEFKYYFLNKTPNLCFEKNNQYLDMLESLRLDLVKYNDTPKDFKLIFSGVNSRVLLKKQVEILRNILLVEQYFIFPITSISGYVFSPNCSNTNKLAANEIDSNKSEKGGIFNV